ncbi:hypothetical protein [Chloroflexus sp.]|uniref:hypothetical protein n=1 Tax=Chloroflexus sp. TaxID=1904827 RepID=UPI002ACD7D8F|nr:hypothetical protein [Chloroflexus sp.]
MEGRSRYLDMVRGQYRRSSGWQPNAKDGMTILALLGMGGAAAYWWGVQSALTDHRLVAAAFTVLLTLAPPSLTSFLIPWSPAGMLLQKVNLRTWGYAIVIACSLFFLYYSGHIQYSWWAAQQVVADTQLILQQVIIGILGFIIIPALLWTPVTSEELVEQVRQAHLVKRYELQTEADIAILRSTLLRAQQKALIGFCNLTVQEKEELAGVMRGLVKNIDYELRRVGESVDALAHSTRPFATLDDNDDIASYLGYVADELKENALLPRRTRRPDIVPSEDDAVGTPKRPRVSRDG